MKTSNYRSFQFMTVHKRLSWQALHNKVDTAAFSDTLVNTHFTQGGLNFFTLQGYANSTTDRAMNKGREGFFGWMGFGGSIFQWHPKQDIGFAFVPTSLHMVDMLNERGKVYQAEVLRCAGLAK